MVVLSNNFSSPLFFAKNICPPDPIAPSPSPLLGCKIIIAIKAMESINSNICRKNFKFTPPPKSPKYFSILGKELQADLKIENKRSIKKRRAHTRNLNRNRKFDPVKLSFRKTILITSTTALSTSTKNKFLTFAMSPQS